MKRVMRLEEAVPQTVGNNGIHFFSPIMKAIHQQAIKYHNNRSIPVLIQGETGTGKEVFARIIHSGNMKEAGPFIDINCAAISPRLFESEFFGYEAGSFTGGLIKGQKGKFDLASGGTLFLDEITEIPLDLQGKLLRAIEELSFYRVGGLKKVKLDLRIVCATNKDIGKMVKQGYFRSDLYYRLKVGSLSIPPLRNRKEELIPLSNAFLTALASTNGKCFERISQEAANIILNYDWPGNVRELRNTLEWVTIMYNDTELTPTHLSILGSADMEETK